MTRTQVPRRILPRPGAIGVALLFAGVVVLLAAALNRWMLGPDPELAFDCRDTTCDDLWIGARIHHREVALWTLPAILAGWVLLGLGRPRGPVVVRSDHGPRAVPSPGRRILIIAIRAGVLLAAMYVVSSPAFVVLFLGPIPVLAVVLVAASIVCGLATTLLQQAGVGRRTAWYLGGVEAGVAVGLLAFGLLWVIGPRGLEIWRVVVVQATTAIAVSALHEVFAVAGARRARRVDRGVGPTGRTTLAPIARVGEIAIALVLGLAAVWASSPFPAPPRDARSWDEVDAASGAPSDPVAATSVEIPPASGRPPLVGATRAPEPPELQGVPDCTSAELEVVVGRFDSVMFNSVGQIAVSRVGDAPCALRGRAALEVSQGKKDLHVDLRAMDDQQGDPSVTPYEGVLLVPGARATSELSWPGYRDAADATTPQVAGIRLADGTLLPARLEGRGGSGSRAPFDITEGAVIEVGTWQVA